MSGELRHVYETDGSVEQAEVRANLEAITEDDVSKKSPVTAGASEVSVQPSDDTLELAVGGHGGEWSKTTEEALRSAVQNADGVGDLIDSEGGYDG